MLTFEPGPATVIGITPLCVRYICLDYLIILLTICIGLCICKRMKEVSLHTSRGAVAMASPFWSSSPEELEIMQLGKT